MKKNLTEKQKKEYLKSGYGKCPKCKSSDIEGSSFDVDDKYVTQDLTCNECGFSYRDVYTLSNVEVIA